GEHGLTLVRYDSDGSLDSTLGAGGISPDPSSPDWPPPSLNGGEAAFLQPDGKIVVLIDGAMVNGVLLGQGVARFNANGTPDQTFGTDGVVRVPTPPTSARASTASTRSPRGRTGRSSSVAPRSIVRIPIHRSAAGSSRASTR